MTPEDSQITPAQINDEFNWLEYESDGGPSGLRTSRVTGIAGWEPPQLQSGVPRADALKHGYYIVYEVDRPADGGFEDYFYVVTLDAGVHEDYENLGIDVNATALRSLHPRTRTLMPFSSYLFLTVFISGSL